jgi:hypothetical protein
MIDTSSRLLTLLETPAKVVPLLLAYAGSCASNTLVKRFDLQRVFLVIPGKIRGMDSGDFLSPAHSPRQSGLKK